MASKRAVWLGLDLGTQSVKAVVWRRSPAGGQLFGEGSSRYEVSYPRPGWAEQDPSQWERGIPVAISRALAASDTSAEQVVGIGITGQLDGTIAVGSDGQPLAPALIWQDKRASCELAIAAERVQELTGQVLDASHLAPKARHLMRTLGVPIARFHQPVSYLVERLVGRAVTDPALASMTLLFELQSARWSPELCAAWDLSPAQLPELALAHQLAGQLHQRGAELTGLLQGTPVCVGTGDDFAAALGAGLVAPGPVSCSLGTAQVVGALSHTPVLDRLWGLAPIVETHHFPAGGYFVENPGWTCGGAVAWVRRLLGFADDRALDAAAADAPPGSAGVGFFPALAGAMTPAWEARARGAFFGLSSEHERGHLARAVLESCAFACRDVVERMTALGVRCERVLLSGGGSASALWAQLHADVLDRPVALAAHPDATAMGAALLAAVATGAASLDELPALAGAPRAVLEPTANPALDQAYQRYRDHAEALVATARRGDDPNSDGGRRR